MVTEKLAFVASFFRFITNHNENFLKSKCDVITQVEDIVCARLSRRQFLNAHRGYGAFKHTQQSSTVEK